MAKQNGRTRAVKRIESVKSKLADYETSVHLQQFLMNYFLCEMACKELIVGWSKNRKGQELKYADIKMNLRVLNYALDFFGVKITKEVRRRLFSANSMSAKKIRDSLVHGISKKNIEKLNAQYTQIMVDMELFINAILE